MTTGRINQVTIVCRGWPPAHLSAPERFSKLLVGAPEGAPLAASSAGPTAPRTAIRFPPLSSPGHPSAAPHPLWAVWLRRPRRRTQRGASTIAVSATRGYLPMLSGRSSQRPVTHRAHPAAAGGEPPSAIARQPQYAVPPERPVSWGSTPTMNPPRARPEPASLFRGPRSGCLQDQVLRGVVRRPPGCLQPACFAPSHIPSGELLAGRTPGPAPAPPLIFRKIRLYGQTKKSTHGHPTTRPFRTHLFGIAIIDAAGPGESVETPQGPPRRRGRAAPAASRVARLP